MGHDSVHTQRGSFCQNELRASMLFTQTGPCFCQNMSVGTFHSRGQGVGEERRVSQSGGGGGLTQHPLYYSHVLPLLTAQAFPMLWYS